MVLPLQILGSGLIHLFKLIKGDSLRNTVLSVSSADPFLPARQAIVLHLGLAGTDVLVYGWGCCLVIDLDVDG